MFVCVLALYSVWPIMIQMVVMSLGDFEASEVVQMYYEKAGMTK